MQGRKHNRNASNFPIIIKTQVLKNHYVMKFKIKQEFLKNLSIVLIIPTLVNTSLPVSAMMAQTRPQVCMLLVTPPEFCFQHSTWISCLIV